MVPLCCLFQMCCNGDLSPRPKVGYNQCCGSSTYDQCHEVCCDGKVYPYSAHNCSIGCCDCGTYDKRTHCCCDGVINEKVDGKCRCCGEKTYSYLTHTCCGSTLYARPLPGGRPYCCGDNLYDYDTHRCCSWYDYKLEKTQTTLIPKGQYCCKDKGYDYRNQVCCSSSRYIKTFEDEYYWDWQTSVYSRIANWKCCGVRYYNPQYEICCREGVVIRRPQNKKVDACCGDELYLSSTHICCEGNILYQRIYGGNTQCCGSNIIDNRYDICCHMHSNYLWSGRYKRDADENSPRNDEIDHPANPKEEDDDKGKGGNCPDEENRQMFGNGEKSDCPPPFEFGAKPKRKATEEGEEKETEDEENETEEGEEKKEGKERKKRSPYMYPYNWYNPTRQCCGETSYSVDEYICCNGALKPREFGYNTGCCGDTIYDYRTQSCCCNEVYPGGSDQNYGCCNCKHYNYGTHTCCCGGLVLKKDEKSNRHWCCNKKLYDYTKEKCCCDQLIPIPDTSINHWKFRCCGVTLYNRDTNVCCYGTNTVCEQGQSCCGGHKCYDPTTDKCCWINSSIIPLSEECPTI